MKVVPRSAADSVEAAPPPQNASLHAIASSNADAESPLFRTPSPHTSCDTCQHSNTLTAVAFLLLLRILDIAPRMNDMSRNLWRKAI